MLRISTHVVCQHAVQPAPPQERQPVDAILLVRPQLPIYLHWSRERLSLRSKQPPSPMEFSPTQNLAR
jgi:hypothetical protein